MLLPLNRYNTRNMLGLNLWCCHKCWLLGLVQRGINPKSFFSLWSAFPLNNSRAVDVIYPGDRHRTGTPDVLSLRASFYMLEVPVAAPLRTPPFAVGPRAMPSRARAPHAFGCTGSCCQAAGSRSLDVPAGKPSVFTEGSAALRSSGPPRTGAAFAEWATPAKAGGSLARSLPIKRECAAVSASDAAPSEAGASEVCTAAPPHPTPLAPPTSTQAETVSDENDVVGRSSRLIDRVVGDCVLSPNNGELRPEQVFAPIFHSVSVPGISGGEYLVNHLLRLGLARKEHLSEPVVLHAFLLIDRILQRDAHKGFHLCTRNIHRVLLATVLLSSKLLDDECYNNNYWASVGGVRVPGLPASLSSPPAPHDTPAQCGSSALAPGPGQAAEPG